MKRSLVLSFVILLCMFATPRIVHAEENVYYTNNNGVEMDEDNYNNLVEKLTLEYVSFMTQREYDSLKNHELPIVAEKSIVSETLEIGGIPMEVASPSSVSGNLNSYKTTSKQLSIIVYNWGNGQYYVKASNEWLTIPKIRNYDVFAMRPDDGFSLVSGTPSGTQYYTTATTSDAIIYQPDGANTVTLSNGFGMSMNLVDNSDVDSFLNTITARVSGSSGTVSASYQHCTSNSVTKAQSMDYYLSVNGLGGVIMFNNASVDAKYDGMMGVYARV